MESETFTSKFKVGDKIRRVKYNQGYSCPIGFITEVTAITSQNLSYTNKFGNSVNTDKLDAFELVKEDNIKFEVCDKVRRVKNFSSLLPENFVTTVTWVNDSNSVIKCADTRGIVTSWDATRFELVERNSQTKQENQPPKPQKETIMKFNFKAGNLPVQVAAQAIISRNFDLTQFEKDIIDQVDISTLLRTVTINHLNKFKQNWDIKGISLYNKLKEKVDEETLEYKCAIIYTYHQFKKHKSQDHSWLKDSVTQAILENQLSKRLFISNKVEINYDATRKAINLDTKDHFYETPIRFIENEICL